MHWDFGHSGNLQNLQGNYLQCVDEAFPILIAAFFQNCFGLSKEECNFFVAQGA